MNEKKEPNINTHTEETKLQEEKSLQKEVTPKIAHKQSVDWKERYLCSQAEFENYKKRNIKELMQAITFANKKIILKLLDVLDDFDKAMSTPVQNKQKGSEEAWKGIKLIHDKCINILKQEGVKSMQIQKGDPFDPHYHEAFTQVETDEDNLDNKIIEVLSKGYLIKDEILRIAKVVTGKSI